MVLPQIPVQQQPRLDHVPQLAPAVAPQSGLSQHLQASAEGSVQASWEAFQQLRKQLDESHGRTVTLHQQVSQLQLTHEKEAASFRDAANAQIEQQRKALETTTEHYNELQLKVESMTALLSRKAEQIVKLEQNLHERTVAVSAMTQKVAHMDDRVKLSDSARQIAEVRCRELELTLDHSSHLVETLRKQLSGSYDDKVGAMQQQYQLFEHNRDQLVKYFSDREQFLVGNYNTALQNVQVIMEERMADREVKISSHWENIMAEVKLQYERLQRDANTAREDAHQQIKDFREKMYTEREKADANQEKEIAVLEQRHREREDHILSDIARRERELGEREQKYRVQRAQDEQDAKISLLSKEAELKSYYEKMMEDLRNTQEKDRDRLITTFRDQIQQLSAQHLNNERELERMHREKEREMAQRYRVAGYEVDDRKGQVDLSDVTQKTQSALLSKFDNVETRQRERAEQSRAAFRTSTSLSSVGLPPGAAPSTPASATSAASPTS
jgi:DNA repair exonuclease SbcCD ATPase subunit